jgi:hypothetical protein
MGGLFSLWQLRKCFVGLEEIFGMADADIPAPETPF